MTTSAIPELAPIPDGEPFDPRSVDELPVAARRWSLHAIAPGAPLRRSAQLASSGRIKLGAWQHFEADWHLSPPDSFVWRAQTRWGPIRISGADRFDNGIGSMQWRLYGRIPIVRASGADVSRSAAGRVAAESCFVPASLLRAQWQGIDVHLAAAFVTSGEYRHRLVLRVDDRGRLTRVDVARWGNPDGTGFKSHRFTAMFSGPEISADGFTVPAGARAGWWHCADGCARGEFFRFRVDALRYF